MRRALLLALAAAACARPERDAAAAVRRYDDELVRAYRLGDASGLPRVATEDEVRRVTALIDLKSAAKLVLESDLETFRVDRVEVGRDASAAVVQTTERWRYFDRHLVPGEAPGPTFESEMAMRYDLVRDRETWKVRAVTTISNQLAPATGGGGASR
jgi:hypothetical protein